MRAIRAERLGPPPTLELLFDLVRLDTGAVCSCPVSARSRGAAAGACRAVIFILSNTTYSRRFDCHLKCSVSCCQ
jgi:hypothetical protein